MIQNNTLYYSPMLPTPDTSHVSFDNVYEPSEDSYLLLDTLSSPTESAFLTSRFNSSNSSSSTLATCPLILEIGTGSGVVLAFAAGNARAIFGRDDVLTMGTDVNSFACRATRETVRKATAGGTTGVGYIGPVHASLSSPIRLHSVDVLIFNPPYVPSENVPVAPLTNGEGGHVRTSRHEIFVRDNSLLALATDGGEDGMEVTNLVLRDLPNMLRPETGVAYVLLCAQNRPEVVKANIASWEGDNVWVAETVRRSGRHGGWEKLEIVRIMRRPRAPMSESLAERGADLSNAKDVFM